MKKFVTTSKDSSYFLYKNKVFVPIGHNESIEWPNLYPLFENNTEPVEEYFKTLKSNNINCIHLMLEDFHSNLGLFETKVGVFNKKLVEIWDQIFLLAEKYEIKIILAFFDTFWLYRRWDEHPYNKIKGGIAEKREQIILNKKFRNALKNRIAFVINRWGESEAIFAWDLWNEIHTIYADNEVSNLKNYVSDISEYLKNKEIEQYGERHLQTVSVFGELLNKKINSEMAQFHGFNKKQINDLEEIIFNSKTLDFATYHAYRTNTIDDPKDTVTPAIAMGNIVYYCKEKITDFRPFFESEHGPIYAFKDKNIILEKDFDTEYFKHISWAHLASGGAGIGMRWPNRHPHILLKSMHTEQYKISQFIPLINFEKFRPYSLNDQAVSFNLNFQIFACADNNQAIVWIIRRDTINKRGMLNKKAKSQNTEIYLSTLEGGSYKIIFFDTQKGKVVSTKIKSADRGGLKFKSIKTKTDLAIAIKHND